MTAGLTEEEFFAAMDQLRREVVPTPDLILVSQRTIEEARWQAHMAEVACLCAWEEMLATPRWRWLRRRAIRRQITARDVLAGALRRTFGWGS